MQFRYDQKTGVFAGKTAARDDVDAVLRWCEVQFGPPHSLLELRSKSAQPRWSYRLHEPPTETVDPMLEEELFAGFRLALVFTDTDWAGRFKQHWGQRRAP